MKCSVHDHCAGLATVPAVLLKEVTSAVIATSAKVQLGAATAIREEITSNLLNLGWSDTVRLSQASRITITSVKQNVGLCLQTGNMSRMYADLLKLQKLYCDGAIRAGIMIVPSSPCAKVLGGNLTNATRLLAELQLFKKVIHLPLLIIELQ